MNMGLWTVVKRVGGDEIAKKVHAATNSQSCVRVSSVLDMHLIKKVLHGW